MSIRVLKLPRYEFQSPNVEIIITARIRTELKEWVGTDPLYYEIDILDHNGNKVTTLNPMDDKTLSLRTIAPHEHNFKKIDENLLWEVKEIINNE
jgi:hypothetical protein